MGYNDPPVTIPTYRPDVDMSNVVTPTARAQAVTLRTYCQPKDDTGNVLESWEEVNDRATIKHHRHLWEAAGGAVDPSELQELRTLGVNRTSTVAGRTLWLGGTEYSRTRPCCNFNCTALIVTSVYDVVDAAWLLLNGAGVGFKPRVGTLHGYTRPIPVVEVRPSERNRNFRGPQGNEEELPTQDNDWTWTIKVGDSAVAWAKAIGKMFMGGGHGARRLVLSGENVRGPGARLKGYGWICNGFDPLAKCLRGIHDTLNRKAGQLLDELDIMDCVNRVGEVLSSRRSAQACQLDATNPMEPEFMSAKEDYWKNGNNHRRQSNNSLLFWSKPTKAKILELLFHADRCGGDPGIVNAEAARRKCPWFEIFNPCFEIMLPGVCNLVNNCLPRFKRDFGALERAITVIARANYRQTCVDMRDGILQPKWHQQNEALRLCGVSLTGIVQAGWMTDYQIRRLRNAAVSAAYGMADELGMPRPKAVTTVTPAGTIAKVMGGTDVGEIMEGVHRALGRYVFNWVNYSVHDPLVNALSAAGYRTIPNPQDPNNVLVCFPVEYRGTTWQHSGGVEVNLEPATAQLDRYLRWNNLWADHNVSCTVSYSPAEIPLVADWLYENWDRGYIATAFLRRTDPTMRPEDVGQPYLPQEVVGGEKFEEYTATLRPVDWGDVHGLHDTDESGCVGGTCPAR